MKLNAPKKITWIIALVGGLVGLVGWVVSLVGLPVLGTISTLLITAALALSLVSSVMTGL